MPQTSARFCSTCGTSVPAGQRFCSNCGAAVASDANGLPPPPPPDSLVQTPQQALNTTYPSRSSSYYSSPTQQNALPLPDYARVQKRSTLRRFITFVSFLLFIALLVGGI